MITKLYENSKMNELKDFPDLCSEFIQEIKDIYPDKEKFKPLYRGGELYDNMKLCWKEKYIEFMILDH